MEGRDGLEKKMNTEELREKLEELREELEEYLSGLRICDYISRKEEACVLSDFDKWAKTAKLGDSYSYDGNEYTVQRKEFIQVTNIVYDLDNENDDADLPKTMAVPVEYEGDEADYISNETGFCVLSAPTAGRISERQAQIQKSFMEKGINIVWEQFVPDDQSYVFFYGGDIATIQKGKALITLKANGDVIGSLQTRKFEEIDSFKDKCNQGDRHDTCRYIKTNEDLDKAFYQANHESEYILVLEDNNWLEWFFDRRSGDGSGDVETDIFESVVDDATDDIFEALSSPDWLLDMAGRIESKE